MFCNFSNNYDSKRAAIKVVNTSLFIWFQCGVNMLTGWVTWQHTCFLILDSYDSLPLLVKELLEKSWIHPCLVQVWSKYGDKMSDLAQPENRTQAVHCLNELITNALELVPDCITYMSRLQNRSIFNFCAIPQVQWKWAALFCFRVFVLLCS